MSEITTASNLQNETRSNEIELVETIKLPFKTQLSLYTQTNKLHQHNWQWLISQRFEDSPLSDPPLEVENCWAAMGCQYLAAFQKKNRKLIKGESQGKI